MTDNRKSRYSPHTSNAQYAYFSLSLSINILAVTDTNMSQVVLKMVAFRLKYFTHKFEVFDGIVVVISWTLDVASV